MINNISTSKAIRYITAILVSIIIFIAYVLIGENLEWKNGGGAIPTIILFYAIYYTWNKLIGKDKKNNFIKNNSINDKSN